MLDRITVENINQSHRDSSTEADSASHSRWQVQSAALVGAACQLLLLLLDEKHCLKTVG